MSEQWTWDEVPLPGVAPSRIDPTPTAWVLKDETGRAILRHQAPWAVADSDADIIARAPALEEALLAIVDVQPDPFRGEDDYAAAWSETRHIASRALLNLRRNGRG